MTSRGDCCVLEQASVSRRYMLCGGDAVLFGVLIESLLHGARPARAAALTRPVPEVDRLAVRILIDSISSR